VTSLTAPHLSPSCSWSFAGAGHGWHDCRHHAGTTSSPLAGLPSSGRGCRTLGNLTLHKPAAALLGKRLAGPGHGNDSPRRFAGSTASAFLSSSGWSNLCAPSRKNGPSQAACVLSCHGDFSEEFTLFLQSNCRLRRGIELPAALPPRLTSRSSQTLSAAQFHQIGQPG